MLLRWLWKGAILAASELGLSVILVGDMELMKKEAAQSILSYSELVTFKHASEVVAMDESPVKAITAEERFVPSESASTLSSRAMLRQVS